MNFSQKLAKVTQNKHLCVGIDPVLDRFPDCIKSTDNPLKLWLETIVKSTSDYAAAFKPNLAFFETLGVAGDEALEFVISSIKENAPDSIIIGDGKRGDIGSTAEKYASAMFDRWGFDIVTVNPYFGSDGVKPFIERPDKGAYLLAATSNPSAGEVQSIGAEHSLSLRIAELSTTKWNDNRNVGLVVGATRGNVMSQVRDTAKDIPWLIPGIGAQGGDLISSVRLGMGMDGKIPSLINASRSIIYASKDDDFAEKSKAEAKKLHDAIEGALSEL